MSVVAAVIKGIARTAGKACQAVVPKAVGQLVEDSAVLQGFSLKGLVVQGMKEATSAVTLCSVPGAPQLASVGAIAADQYLSLSTEALQAGHRAVVTGAGEFVLRTGAMSLGGSPDLGGVSLPSGGGGDSHLQENLQIAQQVSRSSNDSAANVAANAAAARAAQQNRNT